MTSKVLNVGGLEYLIPPGYELIETKFYEALLTDSDKLCALECGGVDNWDGYDAALDAVESLRDPE